MGTKTKKLLAPLLLGVLTLGIALFSATANLYAAITTPATINYQGRLLSAANVPLTGAYTFRFSVWNTSDWIAGDTDGLGAINVGSAGYAGWQETHATVTDAYGLFNMNLGDTTAFPSFTAGTHKNLQVEVKVTGALDTTYEILDPAGTLADATDRKPLQNQAYAQNADTIDNAELGLATGDIVALGVGNVFPVSTIPGATNADSFTIDNDNTAAGPVILQFGALLAKTLSYVPASSWFEFNDDVNIVGNLTATGTVNGVNLSAIPFGNMATRVKEAVFSPDYAGSASYLDGTDNNGKLELDFEDLGGTGKRNFYEWTTAKATIQDIDVVASFQLPLDFVSFTASPVSLGYQTSNGVVATNVVDVAMYDSTGAAVVLVGGGSLASAAWASAPITFGGVPTFTAGDTVTFRIRLSSTSAGFAKISDLVLNYNGR